MSNRLRCTCQRCTIRGLMGPAVVITVGVLFLLQQLMRSPYFDFSNTYPIILIVIGAVHLATVFASDAGHISSGNPIQTSPGSLPAAPPASPGTPSSSFSGQGQ